MEYFLNNTIRACWGGYLFPLWKIAENLCDLLLHPPGFDVNFFIMGIDVVYAAFRADPVGPVFPRPEGSVGSVLSRYHSGTQRRIFRKERFAAALRKEEKNRKEDGLDEKGGLHKDIIILSRELFCQVGESG